MICSRPTFILSASAMSSGDARSTTSVSGGFIVILSVIMSVSESPGYVVFGLRFSGCVRPFDVSGSRVSSAPDR